MECSSEEGYRLDENSKCVKCDDFLPKCKKCHFNGDDATKPECDECIEGYYVNSEKNCSSCNKINIEGGYCYSCSTTDSYLNPDNCYCNPGKILNGSSCISCPDNCDKCEYNKDTSSYKCLRCDTGYFLDQDQQCIKCEITGCKYCDLDENRNQICLYCETNKIISEGKKCSDSLSYCTVFDYDKTKEKSICLECSSKAILDTEKHTCIREFESTDNCYYHETDRYILDYSAKKFVCPSCETPLSNIKGTYYYWHNYSYIKNTFQCLSNTNSAQYGLYGCELAEKKSSGQYDCLQCKDYDYETFIKVIVNNWKYCEERSKVALSSYCLEAEIIGSDYSCLKCDDNFILVYNIITKKNNCHERKNNLSYCVEAKYDNIIYNCTECADNTIRKDNKCSCKSGFFGINNTFCYKCNDIQFGNPGCDDSGSCEYSSQYKVTCEKCLEGYYRNSVGQCLLCSNSIDNCNKCHYDKDNSQVICDACSSSIFTLNTTSNKCELNDCEEYLDISPGCIICSDGSEEYKNNKKCQTCKYGYFKTKDEKCVYCSSEKYGGLGCYECGYETNEQDNITCKGCYTNFLSKTGKCYDCNIQFADTCEECQLVEDEGTETFKCVVCKYGYYLTSEGKCVSFISNIQKIPNCREYLFSSQDVKFKYITDEENYFDLKIYNYSDNSNYSAVS